MGERTWEFCTHCYEDVPRAEIAAHRPVCRVKAVAKMAAKADVSADVAELFIDDFSTVEHACEIVPGLWLGDREAASDSEWLRSRSVAAIVNAAHNVPSPSDRFKHVARVKAAYRLDMQDVLDFPSAGVAILTGAEMVHRHVAAGETVLVHCVAGISRSAAVVIAYLLLQRDMPLRDAVATVRRARPVAYPNVGFMAELMLLEQEHRDGALSIPPHALTLHRSWCFAATNAAVEGAISKLGGDGAARLLATMAAAKRTTGAWAGDATADAGDGGGSATTAAGAAAATGGARATATAAVDDAADLLAANAELEGQLADSNRMMRETQALFDAMMRELPLPPTAAVGFAVPVGAVEGDDGTAAVAASTDNS